MVEPPEHEPVYGQEGEEVIVGYTGTGEVVISVKFKEAVFPELGEETLI